MEETGRRVFKYAFVVHRLNGMVWNNMEWYGMVCYVKVERYNDLIEKTKMKEKEK